ncbi:UBQ, helicase-c and DEAD-like helicase domain-containing protein [Actinidia rufa]|uniref:UBQ, helicase-c and DEAD-like helicase domain-containing protein n=1 Tax=Actinidia rufa TaxID=165716 RepID=A0A7J0EGR1_9ERIC|nr:UBQ, helicase-c and DEAD-like helicase domain-containing protein [Actinidia rufa]
MTGGFQGHWWRPLVDLKCDRRRIESEFFSGNLCGVAATNALELGIDVGHIDVTLHLGFPGSIASLWQQAGRSGRREKASLAIYVAFEGPLDQYFMKFPQKLFRSPIECCHIDAQNQQVLERHLVCAAVEHPLSLLHDENYFGHGLKNAVMALKSKGFLSTDPSRDSSAEIWSYIGREKMPSHAVSIRAIETEKYKVIDKQKNEVLEEIEESRAFFQVYDGAVYMHQGKTYLVKELDISTKIAWCQVADLKYYTKTRDYTDVHVIGGDIAVWIRVPQSIQAAVEIEKLSFRAGLHAAGHALLNVVPLYIICNSSDLASECVNPHDTRYVPERILLYDQHPGGTGISAQVSCGFGFLIIHIINILGGKVQPLFTELLTAALELLTSCRCSGDTGCPNCVQSLSCHEYNEVLHKDTAIMIIKGVLDAENSYFGELS